MLLRCFVTGNLGRARVIALASILVAVALPAAWRVARSAAAESAVDTTSGGPMAATRRILEQTHTIVTSGGDHNQKLAQLKTLLNGFLDTDALARRAMGKHLDGRSPKDVTEFLRLFRELFIRTYVQRLLLFEVPDFAYGEEKIRGDEATVSTEIVTARDRFAVDYTLKKTPAGWRATDIQVEDVSLAENFRSQFDKALANDTFEGLLARLKKKFEGSSDSSGL
jgi:phospholipid transport system substrate-binding protein